MHREQTKGKYIAGEGLIQCSMLNCSLFVRKFFIHLPLGGASFPPYLALAQLAFLVIETERNAHGKQIKRFNDHLLKFLAEKREFSSCVGKVLYLSTGSDDEWIF